MSVPQTNRNLVIALIAVFAVIIVVSILDQTGDTPPSLPQVESDAGFRVALLSVRESPDGEIVLIFRVEDERPDEPPAIGDFGGPVIASELRAHDILVRELLDDEAGSPAAPAEAKEVEVRLVKPRDASRAVEIGFTQLVFATDGAAAPIDGRWEFTFDPDMAIREQE